MSLKTMFYFAIPIFLLGAGAFAENTGGTKPVKQKQAAVSAAKAEKESSSSASKSGSFKRTGKTNKKEKPMKVSIIFWSGTGNTEKMAGAVAKGAEESGAEAALFKVSGISPEKALEADALALGCPSMGDEVLEEGEMEPFVAALTKLPGAKGKRLALFGSYGWGDGKWMRDWQERMKSAGFVLVENGLILQAAPNEEGIASCKRLGVKLASGK